MPQIPAYISDFLYNWQTLIGSLVALAAALIALVPVYGQLRAANLQSAIALRSALSERVRLIDQRGHDLVQRIEALSQKLLGDYVRIEPSKITFWAWDTEDRVELARRAVSRMIDERIEADNSAQLLLDLRKALSELGDCLYNINVDQHRDPEYDPSPVEIEEDLKAEAEAEAKLPEQLHNLHVYVKRIGAAYATDLDHLRAKVRALDKTIERSATRS